MNKTADKNQSVEPAPERKSVIFRTWLSLFHAWKIFDKINGALWASSFSYYAFFALFPLLAFLVSCASHFTDSETAFKYVSEFAGRFMPLEQQDRAAVSRTIDGVFLARGSVGVISVLGLLWSAIGFFQAVVGAVNAAWGQQTLTWWHLPLKNLFMLTVFASAVLLGVIFLSVLKGIASFNSLWPASPIRLVHFAHILISTAVLFYGFLFFYRFAPRKAAGVTFADVWIPALLVDGLLQISQRGFLFYAANFGNFNAIYGTFGVVIALMLWIYVSGVLIVFGGCLCAARGERAREARKIPLPPANSSSITNV